MNEDDQSTSLPLPPCTLMNAEALIANHPPILGLTETFNDAYRLGANISGGQESMGEIYRANQKTFHDQSSQVILSLAEVLLRCNGNPNKLDKAFKRNLHTYKEKYGEISDRPALMNVLAVLTPEMSPTEIFFSYIAFYRHLMALTVPCKNQLQKEEQESFGVNRYSLQPKENLSTPLTPPRYQPSVQRFKECPLHQQYVQLGLGETSFIIKKQCGNRGIENIAEIRDYEVLLNYCISEDDYNYIYETIDPLFAGLIGDELLTPTDFLSRVFRIQYWFIHIMPYLGGSLAVMQIFRHTMIAYYNYRAQELNRQLLPIVPARTDYFPDLEALLCCATEQEFVDGSMTNYYCVNFTAYLG